MSAHSLRKKQATSFLFSLTFPNLHDQSIQTLQQMQGWIYTALKNMIDFQEKQPFKGDDFVSGCAYSCCPYRDSE